MTLKELIEKAHATSKAHGWWDTPRTEETIPSKLMLIVSELSEALEEYRNGRMDLYYSHDDRRKPEGFIVEIADVFIRLGDLCGALDLDIEAAIEEKQRFNETRSHRHGGKKV